MKTFKLMAVAALFAIGFAACEKDETEKATANENIGERAVSSSVVFDTFINENYFLYKDSVMIDGCLSKWYKHKKDKSNLSVAYSTSRANYEKSYANKDGKTTCPSKGSNCRDVVYSDGTLGHAIKR